MFPLLVIGKHRLADAHNTKNNRKKEKVRIDDLTNDSGKALLEKLQQRVNTGNS